MNDDSAPRSPVPDGIVPAESEALSAASLSQLFDKMSKAKTKGTSTMSQQPRLEANLEARLRLAAVLDPRGHPSVEDDDRRSTIGRHPDQ